MKQYNPHQQGYGQEPEPSGFPSIPGLPPIPGIPSGPGLPAAIKPALPGYVTTEQHQGLVLACQTDKRRMAILGLVTVFGASVLGIYIGKKVLK